jgi:hypothetical protein
LIIDPVLAYSTYLFGTGIENLRSGIAVDSGGFAYVAVTHSINFPTTAGAFQTGNLYEIALDGDTQRTTSRVEDWKARIIEVKDLDLQGGGINRYIRVYVYMLIQVRAIALR